MPERELVHTAVRSLGLAELPPFDPDKKIIEYKIRKRGAAGLADRRSLRRRGVDGFPAPGGGSVAALAGSLGAALSAMVANLTVGKKGYEAAWEEMSELAERAQGVKDLLNKRGRGHRAFNGVMAAMRLPKGTPEEQAARARPWKKATRRRRACRWRPPRPAWRRCALPS